MIKRVEIGQTDGRQTTDEKKSSLEPLDQGRETMQISAPFVTLK